MTSILAERHPAERSFERLYRSYVQDVYRYSLMLLRNSADAEDVAQTTFMKAYSAIQRGERPRHPRRWLITIAHNTCRTRARDDKRRPQEVSFDEGLTPSSAPAADEDVDVPELVKALGALSFNQRSALVMRELEGRSYREIAEVLEISASGVETLLFRARRALREQLEGTLTCGEAERALSLQLDGRIASRERGRLRAHLRECGECASLARRQRARRAALRSLGPLPLPASLASWGGAAAAPGIAVKVAAILAAGVAAVGTTQDGARAVTEVVAQTPPAVAERLVARVHVGSGRAPTARPPEAPAVVSGPPLRSRTILVHEPIEITARPAAPRPAAPEAPTSAPTVQTSPGTVEPTTVTSRVAEAPPVTVAVPKVVAPAAPALAVEVPPTPAAPLPVEVPALP
jgi:RNA polymerase sigma factor (sigma-70 family)